MVTVTISVADELAQELNQIAQERGYANARAMVVARLRTLIVNKRRMVADAEARAAAEPEVEEGIN